MPLSEFFMNLLRAATPGAGCEARSLHAALPSSAGGDDRLAGRNPQDGVAVFHAPGAAS